MANSAAIGNDSAADMADRQLGTATDVRIMEMRRLLDRMSDLSASEALGALRDAFPDTPLHERVRAMRYSRH
jgi:hypothetical protein